MAGLIILPHGEERRSRVSNHEAAIPASSFETRARYALLRMRSFPTWVL